MVSKTTIGFGILSLMATKVWREANADKMRAYRRKHYRENKQPYIDRAVAQKVRRKNLSRELKEDKCCKYCGESFWACLEFHHRDATSKVFSISQAMYNLFKGMKEIIEEIAKCDVVCANCHRKLHYGGLS